MSEIPLPETILWRIHPARQNPPGACLALIVITGGVCWLWSLEGPLLALVAGLLVIHSVRSFLFPSEFELNPTLARWKNCGITKEIPWRVVKRVAADERGFYLGIMSAPHWRDSWKGLHLITPPAERDRILAFIKAHAPLSETPRQSIAVPPIAPGDQSR